MSRFVLKNKKLLAMVAIIMFGSLPASGFAAYFYASPNTATVEQGKTFTMTVAVASASKSTNAVSGTLTYPADMLAVTGVSSGGSIVQQWLPPGTTGPRSIPGSIRFEGVMINGFQGPSGRIFTVTFRAKQIGDATLSFAADQILANDGNATDITDPSKTAVVHIVTAKTVEPAVTEPVADEPTVATIVETEPVIEMTVEPVATDAGDQVKNLVAMMRYLLILIAALLAIIILLIVIIIILVYRGARGRDPIVPVAPPSRAPRSRRKISVKSSVMND